MAVPAPSPGHQATPTSEVTSTGASAKGPDSELYEAIYEFVGTSEGDLSFYVGDIIKVDSTCMEDGDGIYMYMHTVSQCTVPYILLM